MVEADKQLDGDLDLVVLCLRSHEMPHQLIVEPVVVHEPSEHGEEAHSALLLSLTIEPHGEAVPLRNGTETLSTDVSERVVSRRVVLKGFLTH